MNDFDSIEFSMKTSNYQHTGDECPICEDGEILKGEYEKMCDSCYTVIDSDAFVHETEQPWEQWWDHRESEYSGLYGPERVKAVGGFVGVWFREEDEYLDGY